MSATDGEALWSVGALVVIKADTERTNGSLTLFEFTAAAGYEMPYHVHHGEDELYYVLEGEIDCYYGDDEKNVVRAGPDDTVILPRDIPHGFRVVSDEELRKLIHKTRRQALRNLRGGRCSSAAARDATPSRTGCSDTG